MRYSVTIKKSALKSLEKINDPDYSKIKHAIFSLADNPRPSGCKNLKDASAIESGKVITGLFTIFLTTF